MAMNPNIDFKTQIIEQMKRKVAITMEAAKLRLNPKMRTNSFELFGFDFMLDSEFKSWLIEVNTNPCLEESSPLLGSLLPRMIDDLLKLTIDVMYPPPPHLSKQ